MLFTVGSLGAYHADSTVGAVLVKSVECRSWEGNHHTAAFEVPTNRTV